MTQLKILVVGAGVAGSAVAFWLSKLGHDVTVLERHAALRVNGLQLDLRGDGIKVMRIMGLEEEIRAKLVPEEGFELVDSQGRRKAYFPVNKSGKGAQSMTSEFEIMRKDICQLLHDKAVQHGTKYVFGVTVESFEESGKQVDVKFTDGKTGRFDLLIGADGQHSQIRRLLFGGIAEGTKDTGLKYFAGDERMGYFTSPRPIKEGEKYLATGYMLPGKRFVFTRRHNPNEIQWYLKCEGQTERFKNAPRGDVRAEKEAFLEVFQDAGWRGDEIVQALKEGADDFYCEHTGFVKLDEWSRGRVVLLGDAAWCPSANGLGTSTALVGAYVLAGEIATHCGRGDNSKIENSKDNNIPDTGAAVLVSISTFESKMRPFTNHIQKGLSTEPSIFDKIPFTWATISALQFVAGVISFFRLDLLASWVIPDGQIKDWKLPDYKDMVEG